MSYVTLAAFKSYIRDEKATADDTDLQMALDSADRTINEMCQRSFTAAGAPSARSYVPQWGSSVLRIHDCTTVTAVTENSTSLTVTTDYQLEPVQTTTWAGETRPYEQLRRQTGSWYTYQDTATVTVTATWGWAAVPVAVTEAARVLAKDIILHRTLRFGLAGAGEFGLVRARQATLVSDLLAPYRRVESWGIA